MMAVMMTMTMMFMRLCPLLPASENPLAEPLKIKNYAHTLYTQFWTHESPVAEEANPIYPVLRHAMNPTEIGQGSK